MKIETEKKIVEIRESEKRKVEKNIWRRERSDFIIQSQRPWMRDEACDFRSFKAENLFENISWEHYCGFEFHFECLCTCHPRNQHHQRKKRALDDDSFDALLRLFGSLLGKLGQSRSTFFFFPSTFNFTQTRKGPRSSAFTSLPSIWWNFKVELGSESFWFEHS